MSWTTSPPIVFLRKIGRRLGFNSCIARALYGDGYETHYDLAFQDLLKVGDCVWDVGANIGYYTKFFAQRVGSQGCVLAFEPSPINHSKLFGAVGDLPNVLLFNYGLGAADEEVPFQQGADTLGATSRVVSDSAGGGGQVNVRIFAADNLIKKNFAQMPNAIKIDVEGFEPEVMCGLNITLGNRELRLIGIEMHFSILQERGLPDAPRSIETLLCRSGFSINWPDSSHILAVRK